ncbi:hypothetical protein [Bradyrhizobium sp. 197]|uniref:hypothetical protein n=1 Tax=Bradyrhizobium sp. 197 TaxID=2782663 RepID=UPI001FFB6845|nr:hypothetical protein [Bradyrhizobium sp. 197]
MPIDATTLTVIDQLIAALAILSAPTLRVFQIALPDAPESTSVYRLAMKRPSLSAVNYLLAQVDLRATRPLGREI